MIYWHHAEVDSCSTQPLSGTSIKDSDRGKVSQWAEFWAENEQESACSFWLGREVAKTEIIHWFTGCGQRVGWTVKDLFQARNMFGKLVIRTSEKEVWG